MWAKSSLSENANFINICLFPASYEIYFFRLIPRCIRFKPAYFTKNSLQALLEQSIFFTRVQFANEGSHRFQKINCGNKRRVAKIDGLIVIFQSQTGRVRHPIISWVSKIVPKTRSLDPRFIHIANNYINGQFVRFTVGSLVCVFICKHLPVRLKVGTMGQLFLQDMLKIPMILMQYIILVQL